MIAVRDAATSVLRTMLLDQPTNPAKVAFAWQIAAGPAIGQASQIGWAPDGTLTVRARDAAWQHEIRRARPMLTERLRSLLGPDVIRRMVVTDASASPSS